MRRRLASEGYGIQRYWPLFGLAQATFSTTASGSVEASGQVETTRSELDAHRTALTDLPTIRYAAYNRSIRVADDRGVAGFDTDPTDPLLDEQWALDKLNVPEAWNRFRGSNCVTVALIDSGFDRNHRDLESVTLWENRIETSGTPARDDDNNGFIDDYVGWDWIDNDHVADDGYGHGTHVGGTIVAKSDNDFGIAGLVSGVRLMPLRVLDDAGNGTVDHLIDAVHYAVEQDADIINLSLVLDVDTPPLRDAIHRAYDLGNLIIAAAGNTSRSVQWPAAYPQTVAVSATDTNDALAYFSSFGTQVTLGAPGTDILGTLPANQFEYQSGTSMAAAHVSALAATLICMRPDLSSDEIVRLMQVSATDANATIAPGADPWLGTGRIDFQAAVLEATHGLELIAPELSLQPTYGGATVDVPLQVHTGVDQLNVGGVVVAYHLVNLDTAGSNGAAIRHIFAGVALSDEKGIAVIPLTLPEHAGTYEVRAQAGHAQYLYR